LGCGDPSGRAVRDEDEDEVRWCIIFGADDDREAYVDWENVLDTETCDGVAFTGRALPFISDGVE